MPSVHSVDKLQQGAADYADKLHDKSATFQVASIWVSAGLQQYRQPPCIQLHINYFSLHKSVSCLNSLFGLNVKTGFASQNKSPDANFICGRTFFGCLLISYRLSSVSGRRRQHTGVQGCTDSCKKE